MFVQLLSQSSSPLFCLLARFSCFVCCSLSAQRPLSSSVFWFCSTRWCGVPSKSMAFSNPNPHTDVKLFLFFLWSIMFLHPQSLSQEHTRVFCQVRACSAFLKSARGWRGVTCPSTHINMHDHAVKSYIRPSTDLTLKYAAFHCSSKRDPASDFDNNENSE